jgi:hypothetical protein
VEVAANFERTRKEMAAAGHLFKPEKMKDQDLANIFKALQKIGPAQAQETDRERLMKVICASKATS